MIIVISWLGCLKGSYIRLSEGKIWMKNFMYTNCTLLNEDIFLIGHLGGFPARMHSDGNIDYYDMMQGFVEKETGVVIDFMDYFQNKVYALDSKEGNLIIFNLQKQECKYIPLGCRYKSLMNFAVFERYGSDYYIFPKHENSFFIFDTNEEKIRKIKNCSNWWDKIQCACRVKDSIWILSGDTETLWCYYLSDGEIKVYGLERTIKDCVHAFYDGEAIFFLNRYGIIYIWDINKNEMSEITDLETEHIECESVSRIIHAGNRLILLPASGNDIKILDLETEKAEIYQDYPKDFIFEKEKYKFYGYCEDETSYIFAMCFGNYFLKIDKNSGKLAWIKPITDLLGKKAVEFMRKQVIYEEILDITDLLEINLQDIYEDDKALIGKEIYRCMETRG